MTYTNQSIKVKVIKETYRLIGSTTKCELMIELILTPYRYFEYTVSGFSNCKEDDTYVESIGKKIAKARAVNKAYRKAYRHAVDYLKKCMMYNDAYNRFHHKVSDVIYGNLRYIERFRNVTEDTKESEGQKE